MPRSQSNAPFPKPIWVFCFTVRQHVTGKEVPFLERIEKRAGPAPRIAGMPRAVSDHRHVSMAGAHQAQFLANSRR